ncbi:FAD-dependent monooxygenase [Usitatibacter palustris]|uniref:2-octaprenylphenol hydroxylase n=1 Tax=Usitatibacter palustris TaxID=2732487 RepID=A0A6M4H6U9_9PROT|nr:FAD-dependent monooxygenase [Usitatibacter palustris]QJR13687.1 2-octaprenylphenol hydroxylase [Usitatibacter palustris]
MKSPRVLVAGGGPVGLAFACAVRDCAVTVVDSARAAPIASDDYDVRIFALSPGSREFLRDIGAWDELEMRRVAPVRRMEVFGDAGAQLGFSAPPRGALAWIVEAGRLSAAIEAAARTRGSVEIRRNARAQGYGARANGASLELESGERIEGDLLVGADGPDSPMRAGLSLAVEESAYEETAIVANFATEQPHEGIARQWFRSDGVLAWLPLPGNKISIVWSAPNAVAQELASRDGPGLARRVRDAGGAALGELESISPQGRFPLRLIRVPHVVMPGAALIGDAAHGIHPLAGQGVNLGFQDARVLAHVLSGRSALERPGDLRVLRRYARARREDVGSVQWLSDGLDRLFATRNPAAATLRNAGMRLVDSQPWAKRLLAARAMR